MNDSAYIPTQREVDLEKEIFRLKQEMEECCSLRSSLEELEEENKKLKEEVRKYKRISAEAMKFYIEAQGHTLKMLSCITDELVTSIIKNK